MFAAPFQVAANGRSGDGDVRIERVGADTLSVLPGDVVTVVFRVTSSFADTLAVTPTLELPDGWRSLRPMQELVLAPGKPTVRFISILVPENTRATLHRASLKLTDPEKGEYLASSEVSISVGAVHGLYLLVTPEASFVAAGKSVNVGIQATNEGNAPATIIWSADPVDTGHFDLPAKRTLLEPGETAQLTGMFISDADVRTSSSASIRILARIDGVHESGISDTATIDVIPSFERVKPRGNPIPLGLTLETVGNEDTARPAARIRSEVKVGGGTLSVQATMSGSEQRSVYGSRNDIRMTYESDRIKVIAGDHPQVLSPLTTRSETGFGVSAETRSDTWALKATAARNRHDRPDETRIGISASRVVSEASTVSANMLVRNGYYTGSIGTFRFENRPDHGRHSLDVECGISGSAALTDPSCTMIATLRSRITTVRTQAMRTATDYPGSAAAASMLSENISLRLGKHVRLDESIQWQSRSFAQGATRQDVQLRAGGSLAFRIGGGSIFSTVHGIQEQNRYDAGPAVQKSLTRYARITLGYQLPRLGLTTTSERGFRMSEDQYRSPVNRMRGQLRLQPLKRVSVSLSAERSLDAKAATGIEQRYTQWGVNSILALPHNIQVSAGLFQNHVDGQLSQRYRSFNSRVLKRFTSGSELSFQVQANRSDGRTTVRSADYRIAYSVPLLLPGRAKPDSEGLLRGHIFDKVTGDPLSGVLVRYGDQIAITNEAGDFLIAPNPNGESFLFVNPTTLPDGYVSEQTMPLSINGAHRIDIPVVPSTGLKGSIQHYRPAANRSGMLGVKDAELVADDGIHSVVLELSGAGTTFRTRTDAFGSYVFDGIPTGEYMVRIIRDGSLESGFKIVQREATVFLRSTEKEILDFKAVPVQKRIKILNVGASTPLRSTGQQELTPQAEHRTEEAVPVDKTSQRTDPLLESVPVRTSTPSTNWISLLRQTANAPEHSESKDSRLPIAVDSGSMNPETPPNGLIGLLLALASLFILLDLDLIARILLRRRHAAAGIIGSIHEDRVLWNTRQGVLYTALIVGTILKFGMLAGISTSLGLFGITLVFERWDSLVCVHAWFRLLRRGTPAPCLYHGVPVTARHLGVLETKITLLNGQERTLPTSMIDRASFSIPVGAQWVGFNAVIPRSTNLFALRESVAALLPTPNQHCLLIGYEDTDRLRTRITIRALVVVDGSIDSLETKVEALLPAPTPDHLRLVRSSDRAA